jgi:aconitate decarboxylase
MGVTAELCRRMAATGWSEVTPDARLAARRLIIDGLAVGVAGSREPAIEILVKHQQRQGLGGGPATVLGSGVGLGAVAAAAVNGAAMHVLDFEPMWSPANHALSTTLPAVLALAETTTASGAELVTALVKGIELQGWLRQASRQWEAGELLFHPPGVVGPLGAAVAAGHLLGLDAERLRHALGIAASRAGGLMANVGTMTKSLHCGQAAGAGLEAAILAAEGFTANPDIFDDPRGLVAFSPRMVADDLLGYGPPWRVVEPGSAIKLFPCQYGTHFAITAALDARAAIEEPASITAVRLTAPVMAYVDRPHPPTGLAGKFSLQYTAAVALLDGAVGLDSFTDRSLARPELQRLLRLIELTMTDAIPGRFEEMHLVIEVDLISGATISRRCDAPRGLWGAAPVTESEHGAKVADCLGRVLGAAAVDRVIEQASCFAEQANAGVRTLLSLAGGAPV